MTVLFVIDSAEAQSYSGILILDPIPSKVTTGDTIVFSGQLRTTSDHIVPDAKIYIKDDVTFGKDKILRQTTTDHNGEFYTTWSAKSRSSGAWDIYAVFEGSSIVSKAKSSEYSVKVSSSYSSSQSSSNSNPTSYSTFITLDRLPSTIYAGNSITFTGTVTSNGKALQNAFVEIKEDDPGPDQRLGHGRTYSDGTFSITWTAKASSIETEFDIYAVFENSGAYKKARTSNQEMNVIKYGGSIELDQLPRSARTGELITISGTLNLDGRYKEEGAVVYIKDEDSLTKDDLLATAYVDKYGSFSANWIAHDVDGLSNTADIFAVFEGNKYQSRLTTCGTLCKDTIQIKILKPLSTPDYIPSGNEYIELYYSLDLTNAPRVAIVPNPDSYDKVKGHIIPVKEGILMWTTDLGKKFGGKWDISFDIITPGKRFTVKPDIVVNLDTVTDHMGCKDYGGVAKIYGKTTKFSKKPIQTHVCSTNTDNKRNSNDRVAAIAAHEFIHAVGLGHTFNKVGDLMCSKENNKDTCPSGSKSKKPSEFNLDAVVKIYGSDGFKNPNYNVKYKTKFFDDQSKNVNQYVPTVKPDACKRTDYKYDTVISDLSLKSNWHHWYKICTDDEIFYSFSTNNKQDGVAIYVLPPETHVKDFVYSGKGSSYVCEEYGKTWHKKSGSCNIAAGSHIVLHNTEKNTITINGYIRN